MSFTLMPLLNTTDITSIVGEFNHSVRVFETERFNEGRQRGALSYYNQLFIQCSEFTSTRALIEKKCARFRVREPRGDGDFDIDAHICDALYYSSPDTLIGWCSLNK